MSFFDRHATVDAAVEAALPRGRGLYYDGTWQQALCGVSRTINPGTGQDLGEVAEADASDVDRAVQTQLPPLERGRLLRRWPTYCVPMRRNWHYWNRPTAEIPSLP